MKNLFCNVEDLTHEDSVEKFFLDKLIASLNYKNKNIKTKTAIKDLIIGKGSKKENYKPDYVLYKANMPVIVIDAKHTEKNVDEFIYQASGYSLALNQDYKGDNPIKYFALTNGLITKLYNWDEKEPILELNFEDFSENNPKYKKLIELISVNKINNIISSVDGFTFKRIEKNAVEGIFRACHNLIWKKETISPTDAFYEFSKLFFIKLKQDKDIHNNFIEKGKDVPINEFKFSDKWIEKQDANNPINDILFKQRLLPFLKDEREKKNKKRIFEDNEVIELQSATIKEVVKLLQHIDFYNIDEDLNGRMFETFLSATVRGKDLGQFFTPRSIVKFMVKMADIEANKNNVDRIFDGCAGSGGFLIDAMADMVEKIENNKSLSNKEKNDIKDNIYSNNIYGVEKSLKNSRVSRMNLWFHGDGSSNVFCLDTLDKQFRYDPGLSNERKKEIEEFKKRVQDEKNSLRFEIVLTNPPFSTKYEWSKKDEKAIIEDYDISYKNLDKTKNERVSSLKSNVLFIERYYDLLADKGKLLTVIDESVLNAEKESDYRKFILDKFIIKAVISLPRNSFINADTNTKTSILYLRKKSTPSEKQPPIFMAISQNVGHSDSGKPEPEKCDLLAILDEFKKFENGK
ncbi:MAG: N-6 DNA methylase [Crocinitomicaceae bacterium]